MEALVPLLNSPLGVVVALVAVVVLPKLFPALGPVLSALLAKLKRPAPEPTPGPNPADPPAVPATGRPLIDLALKILAAIAARRFPDLTREAALERYLVEQTQTEYAAADAVRAKSAGGPG